MIFTSRKIYIFFAFVVAITGMVISLIAIIKKNDTLVPLSVFLGLLTFFLAIYINKRK